MKILFVDDNELNRIVLHDMMEILFEDIAVETYESAKIVLELELSTYDFILSDIDMPVTNGYELHDILRNKYNYTKPIIAVTALAVSGDREKMLMHGFNDYVSKPIDMNKLESTIKKYI
jgi:two-component system, cell cycle response regulator DivK